MANMYSTDEILDAMSLSSELKLQGYGMFCSLPAGKARQICNGVGPEWLPARYREILDKRYYILRVAAMIHDVEYYLGTGTDEDFHAANDALRINGIALAKHYYPWWSLMRYLVMHDAHVLAKVCDKFGRKAYNEAIMDRIKAESGA